MEPPKGGQIGTKSFVLCREVVLFKRLTIFNTFICQNVDIRTKLSQQQEQNHCYKNYDRVIIGCIFNKIFQQGGLLSGTYVHEHMLLCPLLNLQY